jgi:hypothetical protein
VFLPAEIAIVHTICRTVRTCYLLGNDPITGRNYDHRKMWIQDQMQRLAAGFGIDLLCFAVMSNHVHQVLRSRPDVVADWDDTEVARRWLHLCPPAKKKKKKKKEADEAAPIEHQLNAICKNPKKLEEIRTRLSDISWWMRLLCQRIAQWANGEDRQNREKDTGPLGKFWQNRFKAVRLLDEEALLACAAYVDLNPIRAAMADSLENSHFTSAKLRVDSLIVSTNSQPNLATSASTSDTTSAHWAMAEELLSSSQQATSGDTPLLPDCWLSPVPIKELYGTLAGQAKLQSQRCSESGFLPMTSADYLQLLDWTARQIVPGKSGCTPENAPPIFERLEIKMDVWCQLVSNFGSLFYLVAGKPHSIDNARSRLRDQTFKLKRKTRELLST